MLEFESRREKLFAKMNENSVAIVFSGVSKISSEDEFLNFCVNKNFYYLTGIGQENSILMLIKGIGVKKTYLFIDEYNELKEKWTGKRLTNEQAMEISGVKNVYTNKSFENMANLALTSLNNQYGKIDTLYVDFSPEIKIKDEMYVKDYRDFVALEYPHVNVIDIHPMIRDLRMVKSSYEIEQMVKAINATNNGLNNLILNLKAGVKEYELNAIFECFGIRNGRHKLAFSTIVASGKNATCLHYPTQSDSVKANDLVLFDLGFRNEEYCADISRTYPANGRYFGVQKTIYETVLGCNKAVINHIRAGMTIRELQEFATEYLKNECIRTKLMKPDDDIRKYYFHNVSHHLGLDTHDVSDRDRPLENGNVITVEPGLYFENYGVGVRIEDDVLIQDGMAEVLSKSIKKEVDDIEKLFATRGF